MATANLVNTPNQISTGRDGIVIVDNFQSIRGGRTLDVTGFPDAVIEAGHVIIKSNTEEYKPMPLNVGGTAYSTLPADHTYAGILINTIPTNKAMAGILVRGTVNPVAMKYAYTTIATAVKAALPLVDFRAD